MKAVISHEELTSVAAKTDNIGIEFFLSIERRSRLSRTRHQELCYSVDLMQSTTDTNTKIGLSLARLPTFYQLGSEYEYGHKYQSRTS